MAAMIVLAEFDLSETPVLEIAIPLLGVLLITMGMFMGIRKKRMKPGANVSARDHVDDLRQRQAVRGDLEQLMIEVEQLAKRFGTQLDAKTMQMEQLIDEANAVISKMQKLQEHRQADEAVPQPHTPDDSSPDLPAPPPHPPSPSPQASDPDSVLKQKVYDLNDRGCDPVEIARMLDEHVGKVELILALRKA